MKKICILLTLAICLLLFPAGGTAGSVEPAPEATPWTGDGHWYTFQRVGDTGVVNSLWTEYYLLRGYYYVSEENAVPIGRLKGTTTDVKYYTKDPEERIIWSVSPNGYIGIFSRSGYRLPEPGPETGDLALQSEDSTYILSPEAQAELYALRDSIPVSGEPAETSDCQIDPDGQFDMEVSFEYREIPYLGQWLWLYLTRHDDSLVLLSWKETENGEAPDRILKISPESELYRAFFEALQ